MNRSLPHVVRQAQLLARKSPELKAFIKEGLKSLYTIHSDEEKIAWVRKEVDKLLSFDIQGSRCQKGCHHCCYHPISLSKLEMTSILKDGPKHEKGRLEHQQKHLKNKEPIDYMNKACIFLNSKDGTCAIYDKRPLICRLTHVSSEPHDCHLENDQRSIKHLRVTKAALLVGVFYMTYPEIDLLPLLIPATR